MYSGISLRECEFVAVDLETTGPIPGRNSIIEIGAARLREGRVVETFETLVRPLDLIPPAVEQLTGIAPAMLVGAPDLASAMLSLREFAAGGVMVAHNYRFDLGFLDFEAERVWGDYWPRPAIDTLCLARRMHPGLARYSLASLADRLGTETTPNHRALPDALAAAEVLACMLPDLQRIGVRTVGELAAFCGLDRQTALAEGLRLTSSLPDKPGVFAFRDDKGRIVYIGRAKSLRARTRSYFYPATDENRQDLGCGVASLYAIGTDSPLDAALLERRMLDRYSPERNTSAQAARTAYLIYADDSALPGLRVVTSPRVRGAHAGPFTSRWAAVTLADRLSAAYGLRRCARRLDARLAARPCEHRGGDCPSPCVLPADRADYRRRLSNVFEQLDGDASDARRRFERLQRAAGADQRYEDAIAFRDGVRALDRAMGVLSQVRHAAETELIAIEEFDDGVVIHLIRDGRRVAVVRGPRLTIGPRVERAVVRIYFDDRKSPRLESLTGPQIAEMLIVSGFLSSGEHAEVAVTTRTETIARVRRALGLNQRAPRRRHEAS